MEEKEGYTCINPQAKEDEIKVFLETDFVEALKDTEKFKAYVKYDVKKS